MAAAAGACSLTARRYAVSRLSQCSRKKLSICSKLCGGPWWGSTELWCRISPTLKFRIHIGSGKTMLRLTSFCAALVAPAS
jgi:hypothetical protein